MTRRSTFLSTLTLTALATAALVVIGLGARQSNAGAGLKKHAAATKAVKLDGKLVRGEEGWRIDYVARNAGKKAQDCQITASVMQEPFEPMGRVAPIPRNLGETLFAATVPASGEAKGSVELTGAVAKALGTPKPQERNAMAGPGQNRFVRFQVKCQPSAEDVI